eukprot:m.4807 g.4807  ORF g.4807 m.4807 type:complete len:300 (-) comp2293_c0_seq1:597-1496(-)
MDETPPPYTCKTPLVFAQQQQQPPFGTQPQVPRMIDGVDYLQFVPGYRHDDPISDIVDVTSERVLYIGRVTDPQELGKISCWTTVLPFCFYPPCIPALIICSPCLWSTRGTHIRHMKGILCVLTDKAVYYHEGQYELHPCFPQMVKAKTRRVPLDEITDVLVQNTSSSRSRACCGGCFLSIPLIKIKTVNYRDEIKMRGVEDGDAFGRAIFEARDTLARSVAEGYLPSSAVHRKRIQCVYQGNRQIVMVERNWANTLLSVKAKFSIHASAQIGLFLTNGMVPLSNFDEVNVDDVVTVKA